MTILYSWQKTETESFNNVYNELLLTEHDEGEEFFCSKLKHVRVSKISSKLFGLN